MGIRKCPVAERHKGYKSVYTHEGRFGRDTKTARYLSLWTMFLWECHCLKAPRKYFLRGLELADQSLYAASPTNAMHMVLGKGVEMVPETNWEKVQDLCIMYIAEVERIMDLRD